MKIACETYGPVLTAHIEGALPLAVAAELRAHLDGCEGCRAELAAMRALGETLESAGGVIAGRAPAIDIVQEVLAAAEAVRAGQRGAAGALDEREDLVAYLDGEMDDFSAARIERERAKDAALDAELLALADLGGELRALGAAHEAAVPKVDLVASVLARAKDRAVAQEALPEALDALPAGIRLAAERFIEGEATTAEEAELRELALSSPPLAELLEKYSVLHADLGAVALAWEHGVPRIDIVAEVVAAARKQQRGEHTTPFGRAASADARASRGPQRGAWVAAALAAAACVLFGLYLGQALPFLQGGAARSTVARNMETDGAFKITPQPDVADNLKKLAEGEVDSSQAKLQPGGSEDEVPSVDGANDPAEDGEAPLTGPGSRTLKEMLDARQQSLEDDQAALARLMRWSTLSQDEARKILADKNADPAAILGAAEFLPPNEAAPFLKAAVDRNPEDPYLRKALAKAYTESGDMELARQQLDAWSKMDPENSVPKYLAAQLAFQAGDTAAGVAFMEEAAGFQQGSLYSAQSAQYRRSALAANGYAHDVASFLAGNAAGTGEFRQTSSLANDLLDQGNQLRDAGEYEEAQKVYLGVYNLGSQLSNSAQLTNDFASAYDVQNSALQALLVLSRLFAGVDTGVINDLLGELNSGLGALTQLMEAYNAIFASGDLAQLMQLISATLGGGQLDFLQR